MIDQDIRDALRVDPSPEFLARVRTRLANEPAPSRWRWSWTYAAAGAMAAAVVVAVVLPRPQRLTPAIPQPRIVQGPMPVVSGTTATTATSVAPAPAPFRRPDLSASARPEAPRASARSGGSPVARAAGPTQQAEPEILLDPAERRALRALIAGVRDGRVDLAAAQRSVPLAPMEPAPVIDIDIAPIAIEPIAPPSGAEGARQ